MNRIILIGNGFDLAHGLKTRYEDFINWYWTKRVKEFRGCSSDISEDGLCRLDIVCGNWDIWSLNNTKNNQQINGKAYIDKFKKDTNNFSVTFSPMFEKICHSIETKKWVDIEEIFYKHLTEKAPEKVNEELEIIKCNLIEYLNEIQKNITKNLMLSNIKEKITEPIKEKDIAINSMKVYDDWFSLTKYPNNILLLNFNYTSTINNYSSKLGIDTKLIHIHGQLNNPQSVIFGYGDELDENYKKLLDSKNNEYLKNVKSIRYLESSNYRQLLSFIESDSYQVYIMGHSCGTSDRTLLNTLFEHKNCVSIKPFYYKKADGTDNYMEISQNIARNFTDMKLMRYRVVNKTYCEALPQIKRGI